jgi:hypothetical protein
MQPGRDWLTVPGLYGKQKSPNKFFHDERTAMSTTASFLNYVVFSIPGNLRPHDSNKALFDHFTRYTTTYCIFTGKMQIPVIVPSPFKMKRLKYRQAGNSITNHPSIPRH